jgi:hypothetical protein
MAQKLGVCLTKVRWSGAVVAIFSKTLREIFFTKEAHGWKQLHIHPCVAYGVNDSFSEWQSPIYNSRVS